MSHASNIDINKALELYRQRDKELQRTDSLMELIPYHAESVLDIGARDGFIALRLVDYYKHVTALDLVKPNINYHSINCVQGDITGLGFQDASFDMVLCAEVLEHIQPNLLEKACSELMRVTKQHLIIGVPYDQDIRVARSTCRACGTVNPPWGHVNRFDEARLISLFPGMRVVKKAYIGATKERTNFLSTYLMDLAGNPYGTYYQDEPCIQCSNKLSSPRERNLPQKIYTKLAFMLNDVQSLFVPSQPNWIHLLFEKS